MRKVFMGVRLRRLREERRLTQAALARQLAISPSYLNQIERNQRPLTLAVLLRLGEALGVDVQAFSDDAEARLVAALDEVAASLAAEAGDGHDGARISRAEIREVASSMPAFGRALIQLHRRHREALERVEALSALLGEDAATAAGGAGLPPTPYEEVRDFFFTHHNHFAELDQAAESRFAAWGLARDFPERNAEHLAERLRTRHGIAVLTATETDRALQRRLDRTAHVLHLSPALDAGQRAFQMATQLAFLEMGDTLRRMADAPRFAGATTQRLVAQGLASYFAAALLLPYGRFLDAAETLGYDIDLLAERFGVSFETVCHRLSTMQRPDARGVPFFFLRVDRAGNISKRQSAAHFHFSRVGGTCPLWNVYQAFSHPGRILRQLARMPDGRVYLWIARTVSRHWGGWGQPGKEFAVALGCDVTHAHRLVYARGLDLSDPAAPTPIGMGCRVCERPACPQRAFPCVGRDLDVSEDRSGFAPYAFAVPHTT